MILARAIYQAATGGATGIAVVPDAIGA